MVLTSGVECDPNWKPTTTTLLTTTTTTTTLEPRAGPGEEVLVTHSLGFEQEFDDSATDDSLMADTPFTASVKTGLVDAVSAAVPEMAGKLNADGIVLDTFTLGSRRLNDGSRRLAVKKLDVDYAFKVPDGVNTDPNALGATLVANKDAFESTMASSYAKAFEANTGAPPPGFTGVKASDTAGVKVVAAPTPAPATLPPTTTPEPPKDDGEDEDNSAMILGIAAGGVVGIAIVVGGFLYYQKRKGVE
jgi:hypothetical protein